MTGAAPWLLSPSCSIALIVGSVAMGFAAEAERAVEWGGQAVRLSPFGGFCAGFAIPAALAVPLTEACHAAGLP